MQKEGEGKANVHEALSEAQDKAAALRRMDAQIAVEVMGWHVLGPREACAGIGHVREDGPYDANGREFRPSTHIAYAWLVVEKMREMGWTVLVSASGDEEFHYCRVFKTVPYEDDRTKGKGLRVLDKANDFMETADTAPVAICEVSLEAVND